MHPTSLPSRALGLLPTLLLALTLILTSSCASTPEKPEFKLPPPQALPASVSFDGMWHSPQFDRMYVRREGDMVRGIYTNKFGGTFEGKLEGHIIRFTWIDPGDKMQARRTFQGKGYFLVTVDADGNSKLSGEWGYDEDMRGGGIWEATWMRALDKADPKTLDEYREREVR